MAGMGQSSVISLVFLTASESIGLYDFCNEMRQSGTSQRGTKAHIYEYHDYQEQRLRSNAELPETCSPYQKENSHLHRRRSWLSLQNGSSLLLRNVFAHLAVPRHTSHYKDGTRKKRFPSSSASFILAEPHHRGMDRGIPLPIHLLAAVQLPRQYSGCHLQPTTGSHSNIQCLPDSLLGWHIHKIIDS